MSIKIYGELLTNISMIGEIPGIQTIKLRITKSAEPGSDLQISLPSYENDVMVLDISPPIWGRDTEPTEHPPDPAPPKEVTIRVNNPQETMATAYGFVAGANFLGSSWPEVREEVKLGWETVCSG
jgi:hypothetical protein